MAPLLNAEWYTDPFCSWSFAAEKAIRKFRDHFGERLHFEHRLFVLYRDLDSFLKNHHLERPRDFAPKIEKVSRATKVMMTARGWESEQVPRSTEPCCRYVKAAMKLDPALGDRFLSRLRELAFVDGANIGDRSVLLHAAQEVGIKPDQLESELTNPDLSNALKEDNEKAKAEGVTVRPTLILTNPDGDRVFIGGLINPDLFIMAGEALVQEAS
jgi:predicted DsbA family dithiol-disulfide isomerase